MAWAQAKTARERHEEQTEADRERRVTESFAKAVLGGAHLQGAEDLTQEQIDRASGDENTILPDGLERPARWTKP